MINNFEKLLQINDEIHQRFEKVQSEIKYSRHVIFQLTSMSLSERDNHPYFIDEFNVASKELKDFIKKRDRLKKALRIVNRHYLNLLFKKCLANDVPFWFKSYLERNKISFQFVEKL